MRRHVAVVGAIVIAAGIATTSGGTTSAATPEECAARSNDTVELITECVTLEGVRAHQAAFQSHADANGGTREASSPGYQASVDYVVQVLTDAGYSPVVQDVPYDFFEQNSPSEFEQTAPTPTVYVDQTDFDTMSYSGSGDVTATVTGVDLAFGDPAASTSGCEADDFAGFPAGDIALVQRGACSFRIKADNAEAAGAVAAIVVNQGNGADRSGLLFGTLGNPGVGIPVIGAPFALGADIDGVTARIFTDTTSEARTSYNVIADTNSGDPDNVIVVGAHLDSVAEGPGVQDNGTGSAAILETAVQMAKVDPTNKVRFAWWGAEESGLVGSTYYVNNLSDDELGQIAMNLNFDMIGSPNFARFIYDGDGDAFGLVGPPGSAAIETFFEDFYDGQGLANEPTAFSGRSDYQAFINNGIPAGGLFTGAEGIKTPEQVALYGGVAGEQYDPCYHLACDTYDNISLEVFDQNSDAVAAATITYAMDSTSVTGNQVAFITGNADNLPNPDGVLVDTLTGLGFDVLPVDDDSIAGNPAFGYAEIGIISSSVDPTKIPADFATSDLPMLNLEGFVSDDLGLAVRSGEQNTGNNFVIMDPANSAHPLAAGLTGFQGVYRTDQAKMNFGVVGGDAIVLATTGGRPRQPSYYAYEAGTMLADGSVAPARRVAHFPNYSGPLALTGTGVDLFAASVAWLMEDPPPPPPVPLQILAINDFHGNIATTSSSFGGVGRADFLAANIAAAEAEAENSIFVSAGDLIGASPLISALFHDEPTIEAMNLIGLDINAVGNHEFDEGADELLRMQHGGSHPVDGDLDGDPFLGADFEFLAANVVDDSTGETIFPGTTIREFGGVEVAFIGMTLEGTPSIVTPAGVAGLTFDDEVDTVNALVPDLQAAGIEAIVVLLHEGGFSDGGQNDCGSGLTGPIADITAALDGAVDLVIAGHTNDEFVCQIGDIWVTMADNAGRLFTDIDTELDPATGELTVVAIDNKANLQGGVTPDADLTALIDKYDGLSAPLANQVIGTITADISREGNAAGESALGDVIADAQLAATSSVGFGEADVAFMNPGGIRADLTFAASGGEADGEVTYGEAFTTQPFGNSLVTMTLTGTQIDTLLEQQWVGQTSPRILQVSEGFTYTWDSAAADGSKVDIASIAIDGTAIDPAGEYRVTVNSFLADGGDNFAVLVDGTDRLGGEVDLDALVTYFGANSPVAPGPQDRITVLP